METTTIQLGPSILGIVAVAAAAVVLVLAIARSRRVVTGLLLIGAAAILVVYASGITVSSSHEIPVAHVVSPVDTAPKTDTAQSGSGDSVAAPDGEKSSGSKSSSPPEWVGKRDVRTNTGHIHTIKVGPYVSEVVGHKHLLAEAQAYTREFLENEIGSEAASKITIEPAYIEKHILTATWAETSPHEFLGEMQEMITLHGKLEYSPERNKYFQQQLANVKAQQNVWGIGIVAASVLALIGTLFGYFKLDTATRGYYTTRLRLIASGLAATVCGGAYYLAGYVLRLF